MDIESWELWYMTAHNASSPDQQTITLPPPPGEVGVLIVSGKDRPGIVAGISALLSRAGANIVSLDQYSDNPQGGNFFQRTVFHHSDFTVHRPDLEKQLEALLGERFELSWRLTDTTPKRTAILASRTDHCVLDLLWRQRRGEISMVVPMVISNHPDLAESVRSFRVPFHHVPSDGPNRSASEAEMLRLLQGNVDLVVLARYMRVLSSPFLEELAVPVINIHHSFLPAFVGASPYRRAKERGVKLVGATAHYVTEELDEGPIIEQGVVRVSHAETTAQLQQRGADVERSVLSRAVEWHCQDRVIRHDNCTIVF